MTQDPGRMRAEELECDTLSSPWEGLDGHLSDGRLFEGFEVYVWILKGSSLGTYYTPGPGHSSSAGGR